MSWSSVKDKKNISGPSKILILDLYTIHFIIYHFFWSFRGNACYYCSKDYLLHSWFCVCLWFSAQLYFFKPLERFHKKSWNFSCISSKYIFRLRNLKIGKNYWFGPPSYQISMRALLTYFFLVNRFTKYNFSFYLRC